MQPVEHSSAAETATTERTTPPIALSMLPIKQVAQLSDRARKVLILAREEALRLQHNYVGTEHLLLGLSAEGEGVAAKVLRDLGVQLDSVRSAVEQIIGRGDRTPTGEMTLTPRARKVVELGSKEARRLGHSYLGTEHLLLGLLREGEGIGAGILERFGLGLNEVRYQVIGILGGSSKDNVVTCRIADPDMLAIDMLVEAGIRSTRSDAAAWLISAGVGANQPLFGQVAAKVGQIRRLRQESRVIADQYGATPSLEIEPGQSPSPQVTTPTGTTDR